MVTIINYKKRTKENGETFFSLVLQGGIFMVQSKHSGQFYATAKKTSIPSTFDEGFCKSLIGTHLDGDIVRERSEPYQYTIEGTGEQVELNYRWVYRPMAAVDKRVEEAVFESQSI